MAPLVGRADRSRASNRTDPESPSTTTKLSVEGRGSFHPTPEDLYLATAEFGPEGSPRLARRLRKERALLNEGTVKSVSWQKRAQRAQRLLLQAHARVGAAHDRLLDRVAARRGR